MDSIPVTPIGVIHSPYKEKFGIPRQPGLVLSARMELQLYPPYDTSETFRELEGFSHIWVIFLFHGDLKRVWRPTVRPPRLGGNRRVGVWASRSPMRPNPIGISAVRLLDIVKNKEETSLILEGGDFLDGTPVIDIKPYITYTDSIPGAICGYASEIIQPNIAVYFSGDEENVCEKFERQGRYHLKKLIIEVIGKDPRPAYKDEYDPRTYGIRLYDLDILWKREPDGCKVIQIVKKP